MYNTSTYQTRLQAFTSQTAVQVFARVLKKMEPYRSKVLAYFWPVQNLAHFTGQELVRCRNRAIFVWPSKMVWKVFVICFISQWMKRSKHAFFIFPPKKTLIWRRHCSVGQSCCSMTSQRSTGCFLESPRACMKFFHPNVRLTNQKPRAFVSVR